MTISLFGGEGRTDDQATLTALEVDRLQARRAEGDVRTQGIHAAAVQVDRRRAPRGFVAPAAARRILLAAVSSEEAAS